MSSEQRALIVIDLQNDYFPGGQFPLWNTDAVLAQTLAAIEQAKAKATPVILVQHVADTSKGAAPFFNPGSEGVNIHPAILAAAADAPVVQKSFADAFYQTSLSQVLGGLGSTELLIAGMMTQNCVTHTAISRAAEPFSVTVLRDCCTSTDRMIHGIALNALGIRVKVTDWASALA